MDGSCDDMYGSDGRFDQLDICDAVRCLFGVELKSQQYEALDTLLNRTQDVILIAKTGFGKSIIFQAMPFMFSPMKIALIIMPLNALEEEQCGKLEVLTGCHPFVLNGDSNSAVNLKRIREGKFTHGKR